MSGTRSSVHCPPTHSEVSLLNRGKGRGGLRAEGKFRRSPIPADEEKAHRKKNKAVMHSSTFLKKIHFSGTAFHFSADQTCKID